MPIGIGVLVRRGTPLALPAPGGCTLEPAPERPARARREPSRRTGRSRARFGIGRLREWTARIRQSFWFVPAFALIAAAALATGLVEVDARMGTELGAQWPRLFGVGSEGARGMLTAIATSMAAVAGVVFSVTVVALSLAAGTYSPRVLNTFVRDRMTQVAFGVFVGIFAYCLVVLRTVRGDAAALPFVPSLAVFGALVLALGGMWVLVYFIHHVTLMIQIPTILGRIAGETRAAIDRLFPDEIGAGETSGEDDATAGMPEACWRPLAARRSAYLLALDHGELLDFARGRGAVLRMACAVGDFVIESQPIAWLARSGAPAAAGRQGEDRATPPDDEADADALDALIAFGSERTIEQDPMFGVQQIVDVATRALSPAVNAPSTANQCVDQIAALLVWTVCRRTPSPLHSDDGGLRVMVPGPSFESMMSLAFESLIFHAAGSPEVLDRLEGAARAIEQSAPPERKRLPRYYAAAISRMPRGDRPS